MSGSSFWFTVNGSPLSEKTKEMRFCVIPLRDHRLFVLSVILTNLLVRISVFTAINGKRLFLSARSRTGALRDDSLVRHPDNVSGQDLGLWVLRSMYAKNGTDAKIPSVPIFAYSVQRFLSARSRIGALRDDGAVRGYSRDDSPFTEILSLRPGRQVRQILDCSDKSEKSRPGKRRERWNRP